MKVKIGDKFTDSNDEPIMIILTPEEKELISNMGEQTSFCSFPETCFSETIKEFMKGGKC